MSLRAKHVQASYSIYRMMHLLGGGAWKRSVTPDIAEILAVVHNLLNVLAPKFANGELIELTPNQERCWLDALYCLVPLEGNC